MRSVLASIAAAVGLAAVPLTTAGPPPGCDPAAIGWTLLGLQPLAGRSDHYMAFDSNRNVLVVYGGETAPSVSSTQTWEWNGSTWTLRATQGLDQTLNVSGCFDANVGACVAIGFRLENGVQTSILYAWDGGKWSTVSNGGMPPRSGSAVTFDAARRVLVVFGGVAQPVGGPLVYLNDTWEFDGSSWRQASSGGPAPRADAELVYDEHRAVSVLFGGRNQTGASPTYLADTWEWDGQAWKQVSTPTGPFGRERHQMVYHSDLGLTLLYGGFGNDPSAGGVARTTQELWSFDGTEWTLWGTSNPKRRVRPSMTYAPSMRKALLFGGRPQFAFPQNTSMMFSLGRDATLSFERQAPSILVDAGDFADFECSAVGGVVDFQWYKDGIALAGDDRVVGVRSARLGILACNASDRGAYWLVASDGCKVIQSVDAQLWVGSPCPSDFNTDFLVDNVDLGILVGSWGTCPQAGCSGDVNLDRRIDAADLAELLGSWGFCEF